MNAEYRQKLSQILAKLDQIQVDAESILAEPIDAENAALAEELREFIVDMQTKVEAKLDRAAHD